MKANPWLAILVATVVWTPALWFGLIALTSSSVTAMLVIAVGLVFSMYALAGFSGTNDPGSVGFRASLTGLGVAALCLVSFSGSGITAFAVAAPVVSAGVGGAVALGPSVSRSRFGFRLVPVAITAVALVWVFGVDQNIYGFIAPIVVFPVIGLADRAFERAKDVAAESPEG